MTDAQRARAEHDKKLQDLMRRRAGVISHAVADVPDDWKPYAAAWLSIGFRILDALEMPLELAAAAKPTVDDLGGDEEEFGPWMLQGTRHDQRSRPKG